MDRVTDPHLEDLGAARELLSTLLEAAELLSECDDFAALDARDRAVRELAALGVGRDALRWMARVGPTEYATIMRGAPRSNVGQRLYLTRRLIVIAEGSRTPPPPR
jgi:hypothetical protein